MIPLSVYQRVAESSALTAVSIAVEILSVAVIHVKSSSIVDLGAGQPPDLWFGYTPDRLNGFYDGIGEDGCRLYSRVARWDFFPYMFAYAVLLGSVLIRLARRSGMTDLVAHIMSATLVCDMVETAVQLHGCQIFPEHRLEERVIEIGSVANRLKWSLFIAAFMAMFGMLAAGNRGMKLGSSTPPTKKFH